MSVCNVPLLIFANFWSTYEKVMSVRWEKFSFVLTKCIIPKCHNGFSINKEAFRFHPGRQVAIPLLQSTTKYITFILFGFSWKTDSVNINKKTAVFFSFEFLCSHQHLRILTSLGLDTWYSPFLQLFSLSFHLPDWKWPPCNVKLHLGTSQCLSHIVSQLLLASRGKICLST